MQYFFLDFINSKSGQELDPSYIAHIYYHSIGKRTYVASRDSFGQTSAAHRTCRKLISLNLIKATNYKSSGGYSYTLYSSLQNK